MRLLSTFDVGELLRLARFPLQEGSLGLRSNCSLRVLVVLERIFYGGTERRSSASNEDSGLLSSCAQEAATPTHKKLEPIPSGERMNLNRPGASAILVTQQNYELVSYISICKYFRPISQDHIRSSVIYFLVPILLVSLTFNRSPTLSIRNSSVIWDIDTCKSILSTTFLLHKY